MKTLSQILIFSVAVGNVFYLPAQAAENHAQERPSQEPKDQSLLEKYLRALRNLFSPQAPARPRTQSFDPNYPFHSCIVAICGSPEKVRFTNDEKEELGQIPLPPDLETKILAGYDKAIETLKRGTRGFQRRLIETKSASDDVLARQYREDYNNLVTVFSALKLKDLFYGEVQDDGSTKLKVHKEVLKKKFGFSEPDTETLMSALIALYEKPDFFGLAADWQRLSYKEYYKKIYPQLMPDEAFKKRLAEMRAKWTELHRLSPALARSFSLVSKISDSADSDSLSDIWQALEEQHGTIAAVTCLLSPKCEGIGLSKAFPTVNLQQTGDIESLLAHSNKIMAQLENQALVDAFRKLLLQNARARLALAGRDGDTEVIKSLMSRAKSETARYLENHLLSEESRKSFRWDDFDLSPLPSRETELHQFMSGLEDWVEDDFLMVEEMEKANKFDPRLLVSFSNEDDFTADFEKFLSNQGATFTSQYGDSDVIKGLDKNQIRIGSLEIRNPLFGSSVCKHELGHAVSFAFTKGPLSEETSQTFKKIRLCLSRNHTALGEKTGERLFNRRGKVEKIVESRFAEEDFADVMFAKTAAPKEPNYMCSYLAHKQGRYLDQNFLQADAQESHSPVLYSLLLIEASRRGQIPTACTEALEATGSPLIFKDCFDPKNF